MKDEFDHAANATHCSDQIAYKKSGALKFGQGFSKRMTCLDPLKKAVYENAVVPQTKKGLEDPYLLVLYSGDDRDDLIAKDNENTMKFDNIAINGILKKLWRRFRVHRDERDPIGRRIYQAYEGYRCIYHFGRTKQFTFTCGGKMFSIPIHHNQMMLMGDDAAGISTKMHHCVHDQMDCLTVQFNLYFIRDGQSPMAFLNALRGDTNVPRLLPYSSAQSAAFRSMFNEVFPKRLSTDQYNKWQKWNPYAAWEYSQSVNHVGRACSAINEKRLGVGGLLAGRQQQKENNYPSLQAARKQFEENNYPNLQVARKQQEENNYPTLREGRTIRAQRNLRNGLVFCSDPMSVQAQCDSCHRTRKIEPVMLFEGRMVTSWCKICHKKMLVTTIDERKQILQRDVDRTMEIEKNFINSLSVNAAKSLSKHDVVLQHQQQLGWSGNRKFQQNVIEIVGQNIMAIRKSDEGKSIKRRIAQQIIKSVDRFVHLSTDGEGWVENNEIRDKKVRCAIDYQVRQHRI